MAENQDQANSGQEANQQQEGGFPLQVVTQYLKDMSFENPGGVDSLTNLTEAPTGTIRVDVRVDPKSPPDIEVTLFLSVEAKAGDKAVYMVECEYAGLFRLGRVPQDVVLPLIMIEAPRLLFPFARNLIALAIQAGGFPPLFVNPIDFAALYREKRGEMMAQQSDGNQTVN
ncbi:protein-export chaperone SecB [Dongia soli]|uniref:Protein-export protein SecB n=1 Tax=Dongia soli TaxID=600628 RepID=A0ABU5E7I9_9PROT|nr:protein-export chaperone SecB [Dongia soli]MDY0881989.1 protein-export chaperone SecB [Dongia soli]